MKWYGHMQRMNKVYLKKYCNPPGRNGRPRNSWMQEVKTGMRGKEVNNMERIDGDEWRIWKIKVQAKYVKTWKLCTLIEV